MKVTSALRGVTVSMLFFGYAICLAIATLIYGVVIMVGCFVMAGLTVVVGFTVFSIFFHMNHPPPIQDMALLGMGLVLVASPMLVGMLFLYFLFAPASFRKKLEFFIKNANYDDEALQIREAMTRIAQAVAATMKVRSFDAVVLTRSSTAATLELGRWRLLFVDPLLIKCLDEREISAVVAHELGHLDNNIGLSYSYVRRCTVIGKCLNFEADPKNKSLLRVFVKIITYPMGLDYIRAIYRWGYFTIIKFLSFGINLYTNNAWRLLRSEFHAAEFRADANAAAHYSDAITPALLKLLAFTILQKYRFQRMYETDLQLFRKNLLSIYTTSSGTHPSPRQRLSRLANPHAGAPLDHSLELVEVADWIAQRFSIDGKLDFPARPVFQHGDGSEQLFLSMALSSEPELNINDDGLFLRDMIATASV